MYPFVSVDEKPFSLVTPGDEILRIDAENVQLASVEINGRYYWVVEAFNGDVTKDGQEIDVYACFDDYAPGRGSPRGLLDVPDDYWLIEDGVDIGQENAEEVLA
jgi:hypothetical protein